MTWTPPVRGTVRPESTWEQDLPTYANRPVSAPELDIIAGLQRVEIADLHAHVADLQAHVDHLEHIINMHAATNAFHYAELIRWPR